MVKYHSTRDNTNIKTASEAILQGLAEDGGLFVPDQIPPLPCTIEDMVSMSYQDIAKEILGAFLGDFTKEEIAYCVDHAYDEKFRDESIVPLSYADGAYYMELYHGRTMAFKDMALSILPYLMKVSAKKHGIKSDIVILTATSGDTGKAALSGFSDVEGTKIVVFYPKDGVSPIQKAQMVTEQGKNTLVVGIDGNFDDAQTAVKEIMSDPTVKDELKKHGFRLSSANSINIGRLIPQIVYYVNAYVSLVQFERIENGDEVNVCVPTGNFGNILAAFYAKLMGLPIGKLIVASNENRVLTDFFETGKYDANREFHLTNSPSMDILVSSNLERLIFHATSGSIVQTKSLMEELSERKKYELPFLLMDNIDDFEAFSATEEETLKKIGDLYKKSGYLIDTHTAVAAVCLDKYRESNDERPCLVASTASPFKFPKAISAAISYKGDGLSDIELVEKMAVDLKLPIPEAIEELKKLPARHKKTCKRDEMLSVVYEFLGI